MDTLPYKKTEPRAIEPRRANPFDAGLDLFALSDTVIRPGEIVRVFTGIHVALKEHEVGLYWDKSGRTWDITAGRPVGLSILGGCIDGPYRGELSIVLFNSNIFNTLEWHRLNAMGISGPEYTAVMEEMKRDTISIPYGKAITQFLVMDAKFPTPKEFSTGGWDAEFNNTTRGDKGFGSSEGVIRFIDGPMKGWNSLAHNPAKDVIYEQGHCYVRAERGSTDYRYSPSPSSHGSPLVSNLSTVGRRADGYED